MIAGARSGSTVPPWPRASSRGATRVRTHRSDAARPSASSTPWRCATFCATYPSNDTLAFDRHRLAEIDAQIAGRPYDTDDPGWLLGEALRRSAANDPDLLRAYAAIASLLVRGSDVLTQPRSRPASHCAGVRRAGARTQPVRARRPRRHLPPIAEVTEIDR
jgi:hypothetical protein